MGSVLPMFGGLLFIGLFVVALAVDVAYLAATYRSTATTVDSAAEAGAAMLDGEAVHAGSIVLDVGDAESEARLVTEFAGVEASDVSVVVDPTRICVTVARRHRPVLLSMIGAGSVMVSVRSCADPMTG